MTAFDTNAPNDVSMQKRARMPFLILSTLVLASLFFGLAYNMRPAVEARAIVNVSDGTLETSIPEIAPDFAYNPPTAKDVATWLEKEVLGADQSVSAEGQQLTIVAHNQSVSYAVDLARQAADGSIAYLDDYRPHLLRDVKAWFDAKLNPSAAGSSATPISAEQHLFTLFEDALVDAKTKAHAQHAFLKSQAVQIDVSFINNDDTAGQSRRGGAFGRIIPRDQVLSASQSHQNLSSELDQLRANNATLAVLGGNRSAILERKAALIADEAWVQPVAWLDGPVVTTEQPIWAKLSVIMPASLALGLIVTLILRLIWNGLTGRKKRDSISGRNVANTDHEQIFNDPHWPARMPEAAGGFEATR